MIKSHKWTEKGIKFVYLIGNSPYEIGFQHGKILKKEIKHLIDNYWKILRKKYGGFFSKLINESLFLLSENFNKRLPKRFIEEMRGISDGSGVEFKEIFLANMVYELVEYFSKSLKINTCSGFIGSIKNSGNTIVGKTTDLAPETQVMFTKHRIVFIYDNRWSKQKYLTLSFPALLVGDHVILKNGVYFGVNGGGCLTYSTAKFGKREHNIFVKDIANKSQTVQDILDMAKNILSVKLFIFLITDGTKKNSYVLEMGDGNNIRKFDQNLIAINHIFSEKMKKKRYKKDYLEDISFKHSVKRYENIEKHIYEFNNPRDAIKIIKLSNPKFDINLGAISSTYTVHGMVYYPKKKKLFLPSGNKCPVTFYGRWEEFDLNRLFSHKNKGL